MSNPFTSHPATLGKSYFEHMGQACYFASRLFIGALACAIHGFFPFLCLKTGSNTIRHLHEQMVTHRVRPENQPDSSIAPAE